MVNLRRHPIPGVMGTLIHKCLSRTQAGAFTWPFIEKYSNHQSFLFTFHTKLNDSLLISENRQFTLTVEISFTDKNILISLVHYIPWQYLLFGWIAPTIVKRIHLVIGPDNIRGPPLKWLLHTYINHHAQIMFNTNVLGNCSKRPFDLNFYQPFRNLRIHFNQCSLSLDARRSVTAFSTSSW